MEWDLFKNLVTFTFRILLQSSPVIKWKILKCKALIFQPNYSKGEDEGGEWEYCRKEQSESSCFLDSKCTE